MGHRGTVPPPPQRVLCPPSQFLQIMKKGSVHCASGRTRCTPMQTAFPSVYQFFAAAATFGASSAFLSLFIVFVLFFFSTVFGE